MNRTLGLINHIYLLLAMLVIAGILTAAMVLQYANGEIPCPLCLLQRVAMFGVCFGIMLNLREGDSARITGLSLLFAIFLLVLSVRQTLLDIYPRPGHEYIGTAIFGLHMPVWSVLIALALLTAYALKLAAFGDSVRRLPVAAFPALKTIAAAASIYVLALCAINLGSVIVQCGLDQCHTMSYKLLEKAK
ncbi:MAG: disulfide bond formation protein B [Pseudolabrys sp.]|nr:disulfide bond formation protein B [Pseudolabrys sp.]